MTKKDFQLIASVFKDTGTYGHWNVIEKMADMLATTNPRFDRERFLKACESEQSNRTKEEDNENL